MSPVLHVVFGPPGAGKSTYAREIARQDRAVAFLIDEWMARLYAADMPEPVDFEWMMARVERCEAQIWSTAAAVLSTGTSVVLDLGLMRRSDRARVAEIARAVDLPMQLHFVTAPRAVRRERVLARGDVRPAALDLGGGSEMFDFAEGVFEAPDAAELSDCVVSESA